MSGRLFSANCKISLTLGMVTLRLTRKSTFLLTQRHYINLLIDYPFGVKTKEQFDIENAKQILEEDHFGMKKVKQRILEFMAVSKLKGEFKCTFYAIFSQGPSPPRPTWSRKDQYRQVHRKVSQSSLWKNFPRRGVRHFHPERTQKDLCWRIPRQDL